ncbi:polysaccharide biosynthesis/export family protein [Methylosinus sp. Ce-a6]|uniref:polysaccharide biosynthesis/export family protein n=1 Tax=Methylosinus sp. Ce-a6 TaxID=2172005 RepID=UPI00278BAF2E|nr:polysaccharide biosynthesis/export family protein [Methylosinus sp. Ce-a6]
MRKLFRRSALTVVCALSLTGCSLLPRSGPDDNDIKLLGNISSPEPEAPLAYELVPVNASNIAELAVARTAVPFDTFVDKGPQPIIRLGPGDIVSVTIFEAAPGGLFTPSTTAGARPGNFVDIPAQSVDENGNISIPFAGLVPAAGKTIPEVEAIVQDRLRNRAIEPQVVVALKEQHSTIVSVLGEVNSPGSLTLSQSGEKLLELIARAGGPKYPPNETWIILQRNGKRTRGLMSRVLADPKQNIYIRPRDQLYLQREIATFTAVGASGANGLFPFENEHITLSQAIGRAGGLLDTQANPAAVFIYRLEDRPFLEKIGVYIGRYDGQKIPTVYSVDMLDSTGLLLASSFQMREKDAIFVGNAKSVEFLKFLTVVNATASTQSNVIAAGRATRGGF